MIEIPNSSDMEPQGKRRREDEFERNLEMLQTGEEEEEEEEEEEVKRLNSFLQSNVWPILNTKIRLFAKLKRIKLKEKVKALEGQVKQISSVNLQLADSLSLANTELHKKNEECEDLVKKHQKVFEHYEIEVVSLKNRLNAEIFRLQKKTEDLDKEHTEGLELLNKERSELIEQNKKLNLEKEQFKESLKAENKTILNGLSKISKQEKEITKLEKLSLSKDVLLAESILELEEVKGKLEQSKEQIQINKRTVGILEQKVTGSKLILPGWGEFWKFWKETRSVCAVKKIGEDDLENKEVKTLVDEEKKKEVKMEKADKVKEGEIQK